MPTNQDLAPLGTANSLALHALIRKYAEIAAQADQVRSALQRLTSDLTHIEGAIRLFDSSVDISAIRPNRSSSKRSQKGGVTSILLDVLREAEEPLPPRTITTRIMRQRGICAEDTVQFDATLKRVRASLRKQRIQGVLHPVGKDGLVQLWDIVQ
ncbi:MAG: hypothetical protein HYU61_08755 [Brevundimonas diminuta]|jgi:hypothetical protein|uniref:hypothetical protein n=1 Tax=Brevundimonas diminuta TaxID=293 RepID=UPI0028AEFC86|nr:hypothetical protein [Brevundimonas diminuta]MBI2249879.1 hypothetical protein [Brevundimonas diminuta]